jgi:hypothetical protein
MIRRQDNALGISTSDGVPLWNGDHDEYQGALESEVHWSASRGLGDAMAEELLERGRLLPIIAPNGHR